MENVDYFKDMCYKYRGEYGGYYSGDRYLNPHCAKCSEQVSFRDYDYFKFCSFGKVYI